MRQVAHIIRKTDVEKERIQGLKIGVGLSISYSIRCHDE